MKTRDLFLSAMELKIITGSSKPQEQVAFLVSQGLNPYVHPATGCPVIYRDVVMANQRGHNRENDNGFEIHLENI